MRKHSKAITKTPQVTTITLAEDRLERNFARKHPQQWKKMRHETAIHEAAHAVANLTFGYWFESVSIKPYGFDTKGRVHGNDGVLPALFSNRTVPVKPKSIQSAMRRAGVHNAKRVLVWLLAGHVATTLMENPKATTDDVLETFFDTVLWDEAGEGGTDMNKVGMVIDNWLTRRQPIKRLLQPDDWDTSPIYPIFKHFVTVTVRLLSKPRIWKMIQRVAAELVRRRSDMSMDDVLALALGSKEFERRCQLRNRAELLS